jgi:hypothetical protein
VRLRTTCPLATGLGVLLVARLAVAQVDVGFGTIPDLETLSLTATEMDCEWNAGIQAARAAVVARPDAVDARVGVGVRPTDGSRVRITGDAGRRGSASHGTVDAAGSVGLGPRNGRGFDLAMHGRLERVGPDVRPVPMPMQPHATRSLQAIDASAWITRRHGDHGWAFMPLSVGVEDAHYDHPVPFASPTVKAGVERALTGRAAIAFGLRGYENELADGTIAARVEAARTALFTGPRRELVDQLVAKATLDFAATSKHGSRPSLLGPHRAATGIAVNVGVGAATMRQRTTGEHATIFAIDLGAVARHANGTVVGFGASIGPGHSPDGVRLARMFRLEGRLARCLGPLCGEGRAALSWLAMLGAPDAHSTTEHQLAAKLTYAIGGGVRAGVQYDAHFDIEDDIQRRGWRRSIGAVLEYAADFARPHSVPYRGNSTITVCD